MRISLNTRENKKENRRGGFKVTLDSCRGRGSIYMG